MTTLGITRGRLLQQGISGTQFEGPSEGVSRLGAGPAQDDPAALWAGGLRARALEGGKQLTRAEMYDVFERGGVSPAGQRGIHILGVLAQEGLICFGPHRGKQPTFVLLEEWVPGAKRLEREEALAELASRHF